MQSTSLSFTVTDLFNFELIFMVRGEQKVVTNFPTYDMHHFINKMVCVKISLFIDRVHGVFHLLDADCVCMTQIVPVWIIPGLDTFYQQMGNLICGSVTVNLDTPSWSFFQPVLNCFLQSTVVCNHYFIETWGFTVPQCDLCFITFNRSYLEAHGSG
jgi:hypothetical protein